VLLDQCQLPVVLAPLAGGPSTPELCAAVSNAGGLGFLAAGYLSASELATRIERTRALTSRPFGVNLFVPGRSGEAAGVEAYSQRLASEADRAGVPLGDPRWDDDEWAAKLEVLAASPVALVSVTFGCPSNEDVARLKRSTGEVWVTVTQVAEADQAREAGADCLVVQGAEAGGHRGGFTDDHEGLGLLPLLQLVRESTSTPLIATGGIMTGAGLAAVLAAGARAGALGTAFLRCPEAGTSPVHQEALARHDRPTALTRAFTGRLARGISNRFLEEHTDAAPPAYPQVHHLTAPLRAKGRSADDADLVNLWAGQAYALTDDVPAEQIVLRVADEARTALERARQLLGSSQQQ
jgi:nitronate monooxygenase